MSVAWTRKLEQPTLGTVKAARDVLFMALNSTATTSVRYHGIQALTMLLSVPLAQWVTDNPLEGQPITRAIHGLKHGLTHDAIRDLFRYVRHATDDLNEFLRQNKQAEANTLP